MLSTSIRALFGLHGQLCVIATPPMIRLELVSGYYREEGHQVPTRRYQYHSVKWKHKRYVNGVKCGNSYS